MKFFFYIKKLFQSITLYHISVKVFNFLEQNIKEDEARTNLARLTKGLKLQYKEANAFIETLLKALTMEDGDEDILDFGGKVRHLHYKSDIYIIIPRKFRPKE